MRNTHESYLSLLLLSNPPFLPLFSPSSHHRMDSSATQCQSLTRDSCYWWQKTLADTFTLSPSKLTASF